MRFSECVDDAKRYLQRRLDRELARREAWGDIDDPEAEALLARLPHGQLPFSLRGSLLYLCRVGSTAYSLRVPGAGDDDAVAVLLPPAKYVLGLESWEGQELAAEGLDLKCYGLRRFFTLLMEGGPAAIETLWVRPEHRLYVSKLFDGVMEKPSRFSSKAAVRAMAERAAEHLDRRRNAEDEGTRAKAAHHALRTARMAAELARTGELQVFREADAEELRAVKAGRVSGEQVAEEVERLIGELDNLETCGLPETPFAGMAELMLMEITLQGWGFDAPSWAGR